MKSNKLFLLIAFFSVSIFVIQACKKNKCKDVECFNCGACEEGVCICMEGFEGEQCEDEVRAKYFGAYNMTPQDEECNEISVPIVGGITVSDYFTSPNPYSLTVKADPNNVLGIIFEKTINPSEFTFKATMTNDKNFTIPAQVVEADTILGQPIPTSIAGTGFFNGNTVSFDLIKQRTVDFDDISWPVVGTIPFVGEQGVECYQTHTGVK